MSAPIEALNLEKSATHKPPMSSVFVNMTYLPYTCPNHSYQTRPTRSPRKVHNPARNDEYDQ